MNVFTTIGVVAALVLTMEKTGEADSGLLVWGLGFGVWALGFRRGSNKTGTQGPMGYTDIHISIQMWISFA